VWVESPEALPSTMPSDAQPTPSVTEPPPAPIPDDPPPPSESAKKFDIRRVFFRR
jgi:hypothetical protein